MPAPRPVLRPQLRRRASGLRRWGPGEARGFAPGGDGIVGINGTADGGTGRGRGRGREERLFFGRQRRGGAFFILLFLALRACVFHHKQAERARVCVRHVRCRRAT